MDNKLYCNIKTQLDADNINTTEFYVYDNLVQIYGLNEEKFLSKATNVLYQAYLCNTNLTMTETIDLAYNYPDELKNVINAEIDGYELYDNCLRFSGNNIKQDLTDLLEKKLAENKMPELVKTDEGRKINVDDLVPMPGSEKLAEWKNKDK